MVATARLGRALTPPLPGRASPGRPAPPFTCFGLAAGVQGRPPQPSHPLCARTFSFVLPQPSPGRALSPPAWRARSQAGLPLSLTLPVSLSLSLLFVPTRGH